MKNSRRTLKIMGGAVIAAAVAVTAGLWYCKEKEIEPSAIPELIETQDEETDGNLRLYFMDVGQGSAALAKLNGKSMLIDGGGPGNGCQSAGLSEGQSCGAAGLYSRYFL